MNKYEPTIGLEIHVELKTKTKMFCSCLNDPLEKEANKNICPICTAQPGSLPVINEEAIYSVIKAGLALNCKIAEKTWFERKNYFYPDLPKGYQITQFEAPLCFKGELNNIKIRRIHLEEDTGRLMHDKGDLPAGRQGYSLVDYNRAGMPLMELVTEPDIHSAEQTKNFAQELQLILRYLGISDADMEKGQMRVEANISLNMGTKVEVKNLNSFKSVEKAIEYEIIRQQRILEKDDLPAGRQGKVEHETRGWNDAKQETFSQRIKETSDDYRYFPEPDLPPLDIKAELIKKLQAEIPELPQARRKRFKREYKLPEKSAEVLVNFKYLADFFEHAVSELNAWLKSGKIKTDINRLIILSSNYIITEFPKFVSTSREIKITAENFAELIYLTFIGEVSSSGTQEVLKEMFRTGADPSQIIESKNLKQLSKEGDLDKIAEKIIKNNPQPVEDYKQGKETVLQFLVGQAMRETKGKANPEIVAKILRDILTK
ncbi:Asp-tRNA(Asn)/Glu-tRNA(Gln) amidotransferase subunit GatB [Patescibacteria group bacterium]|nr:Asp-tRNA(Asn)/Glu-tRNA(Gln) amidotransferase subunit GatB [Patescibacteria group bacterium]MBU4458326.1 Asp-tRNA(Asn)/Glu-tRNA(Gln) amidotransferase subunit GatB [Patescibacteria group bacterium]MCG2695919.1 Asp-tRNA(Asn)/Glu-tRNA(Gln) amidotransferase subunit GatB [Candidatus Portnoybacteria bacterium]